MKAIFAAILFTGLAFLGVASASAQTDVAGSIYGAFSGTTTGDGVQQSPGNSAGALLEVRHIANPILGFEGTYSYNRADQTYTNVGAIPAACPTIGCSSNVPVAVPANAHEFTADWVPSVHIANFRPFGVLGIGALFNQPDSGADTQSSTKAVYVYGAGLDWGLLPHIGLRFQYRGNLYKAPDVTTLYSSSNAFVHTAEPMIGVYFKL